MKQSISKEIEQNIIEVSNTAFFVINSKLDIVFANPACELLLQLSARRLCKKKLSELATLIDLNTDHIEAILDGGYVGSNKFYEELFKEELKFRKNAKSKISETRGVKKRSSKK